MQRTRWRHKLLITTTSCFALLYCVIVLSYVATVPDLRLRVLLADDDVRLTDDGVVIRDVSGLVARGPQPDVGDILTQIGDHRIHTFYDFANSFLSLRRAITPPGGRLKPGEDPFVVHEPLPRLVEVEDGPRYVEIEFRRQQSGTITNCWVMIQTLPLSDMWLTFFWFLLQLGITGISSLAVWYRPYDRPARLFFAMCVLTLGAFVAGFHWWVVASSLWLNIPFTGCALLVPVVSLHFFLTYPRRTWPLTQFPKATLSLLYFVPAVSLVWLVWMLGEVTTLPGETDRLVLDSIKASLLRLRDGIYVYMTFAAGCFLVMLAALAHGCLRATNLVERNQLKWMFWGGLSAVLPVSYTLYLALFDRVEFALGHARLSMFLASLSFMLAYAVAIVRFKLMLLDQIISKGMRYYAVSIGLTAVCGALVAICTLTANFWSTGAVIHTVWQQVVILGAIVSVAVMLLLWGRDRLQQMIDRRFYREKYQLDKALQRMNRAVERVVDRETLAQRMVSCCRDVLRVGRIAVYLRDASRPSFQLIAAESASDLPPQIVVDDDLMQTLQKESAVARTVTPIRGSLTSAQQALRTLRSELIYAFESDREVAGVVVLGPKLDGNPFTAEDLTFLNAVSQITSVALHSVKVHQDLSRLNEEMQLKTEKLEEQRRVISILQDEIKSNRPVDDTSVEDAAPEEFRRGLIRGGSQAVQRVLETVRKVAQSESSVLVTGASGTGKELLAHAIHENSSRRNGPMVSVHCAALSASLLESELFGHVKGAFTGAHKDRVGRFELAHGGTLFLDEIGDISLETQVKLLRVLQTRQFEPVGGTRTVQVDVRLIAATNQDLKKLIAQGRFREDLFYRLNVISIVLPTLAERKEDILELAMHFLKRSSERLGKQVSSIDDDALAALKRYSWPGNIRELENVVERAVVLAEKDVIQRQDLPQEILGEATAPTTNDWVVPAKTSWSARAAKPVVDSNSSALAVTTATSRQVVATWDEFTERETLETALRNANGNKAEAARLLGIPRSTFFSKLRKHRIGKPR